MPINPFNFPEHGSINWDAALNSFIEALRVANNSNESAVSTAASNASNAASTANTAQTSVNTIAAYLPQGTGSPGQITALGSDGKLHYVNPSAASASVSSVQGLTGDVVLTATDLPDLVSDAQLASAIAGLYTKPSGGIPKLDLDASVQSMLDLANTALQSVPTTYTTDAELSAAIATITLASLGGAPLDSPALTGVPSGPTAVVGTNTTQLATTAHVKASLDALINGAPGTLDTLKEIADTLASDESTVAALTSTVANKVPQTRTINTYPLSADVTLNKADIGLANVDNTSDVNKPVSTATQTALNAKAPLASPTFTGTVAGITKAMVGLGNVDNTADASKSFTAAQISNASTIGRNVLTAADASAIRTITGAAIIGTTSGTAADAATVVLQTSPLDYNRVYSSGVWPLRGTIPDGSRAHWWGPSFPPIGAGYAVAGDAYTITA